MSDRTRSPASVFVLRYALEARLASSPSASGPQIDRLRQGTTPSGGSDSLERVRIDYADLCRRCKGLTEEEERVCRLRYGSAVGTEVYERWIGSHNLEDAEKWQGEVLLGDKDPANPELRKVLGVRARWPSYGEIGGEVGLSERQVKARLASAADRVRRTVGDDGEQA